MSYVLIHTWYNKGSYKINETFINPSLEIYIFIIFDIFIYCLRMSHMHKIHFSKIAPSQSTSTHFKPPCFTCNFIFSLGGGVLEDKYQVIIFLVMTPTDMTTVASAVYIL